MILLKRKSKGVHLCTPINRILPYSNMVTLLLRLSNILNLKKKKIFHIIIMCEEVLRSTDAMGWDCKWWIIEILPWQWVIYRFHMYVTYELMTCLLSWQYRWLILFAYDWSLSGVWFTWSMRLLHLPMSHSSVHMFQFVKHCLIHLWLNSYKVIYWYPPNIYHWNIIDLNQKENLYFLLIWRLRIDFQKSLSE